MSGGNRCSTRWLSAPHRQPGDTIAGRRPVGAGRLSTFHFPELDSQKVNTMQSITTRPTNRPVPSAIDGKPWTVEESDNETTGATDMRSRHMVAPRHDTEMARLVRLHELAHAKITPRRPADKCAEEAHCSIEALQWSEDNRVGRFLQTIPATAGRLDLESAIADSAMDDIAAILPDGGGPDTVRALAGILLADYWLGSTRHRWAAAAVRAGKVTAEQASNVVDRVDTIVSAYRGRRRSRANPFSPAGMKRITYPMARAFDIEFPDASQTTESQRRAGAAVERVAAQKGWGILEAVDRIPMPRSIRPRRAPRRRFADSGVNPTAMHRLTTDQRVFASKVPQAGGTILCDASGSMSYSADDIERIIAEAPATLIAFYAGESMSGGIIVAAEGGRAADPEDVLSALYSRWGGGNEIDGPALRWLARQPGPRFWVSDEHVGASGMDFGKHGAAWHECMAICRAASVRVVDDIGKLRFG